MEITQPTTAAVEPLVDCRMELAADQQQYGSRLSTEANRQAVSETIARHIVTGGLLVAREDEAIRGFVMYHVEDGRYQQDETTGIIVTLYVRSEFRDDGIGSELLAAAEEQLAAEGVDTVTLEVLAANDDARRFYSRQGYRTHRLELAKRIENDTHSKDEG
ncbi:GNAT family N-acetyltransferase [Halohasta salina]|uniref:GNAT family N-acetyltransferase n=1 Tax=Halohasta salina TaxID=2961621 RepID=UPI0020A580B3|nr:GNAT family N-acetyltransferase [Halohasta salina]